MKAEDIIEEDEELINLPAECSVCGKEVERESGDSTMIKLDNDRNPVCEKHSEKTSEVVTTRYCCGKVNNGLHPETGDPIEIESTSWLKIKDSQEL